MNAKIGFALIGCGDIGGRNAGSIAEAEGTELVRLVDANAQAAGRLGKRFGADVSTSLSDALSDPKVDAVFIATPHDLHAAMVIEAAEAGKHIVVEKPIATTLSDAEIAIAACHAGGVRLSVCHPRRYEDKIAHARHLFDEGRLGRLLLTVSRFLKEKEPDYWHSSPWRGDPTRSGGGVLIMNLVHHLDALQVITGRRVVEAVGLTAAQSDGAKVEDTAGVAVRYDSGALGTLAACSSMPGKKAFADEIYGEKGRVVVEKRSVRVQHHDACLPGRPATWDVAEFEEDTVSKTRFVEAFVRSIMADEPPPVPGSYGLDLLRIVAQVYQTARSSARPASEEVLRR